MIYLDNAATTKPSEAALRAFLDCSTRLFYNSSSTHAGGSAAKAELEKARFALASCLEANSDEIIFTSGGTESNNLVLQGLSEANPKKKRLIISAVEHPSVYKTCRMLRKKGYEIVKIPVTLEGDFDEELLASSIDKTTLLVSFMMVNNETGTLLPLQKVVGITKSSSPDVLVHSDAVQCLGKLPLSINTLGVDLMSFSAHKIHGLKGAGALFVRKGVELYPLLFGGGQESGLRSGTEAVPLIASFAEAAKEAREHLPSSYEHVQSLKHYLMDGLAKQEHKGIIVNSSREGSPYIVNFSYPSKDPSDVVDYFSQRKIYLSQGAACRSNHAHGPSMLMSFGIPSVLSDSALRISLSRHTTQDDIDSFLEALQTLVE